MPIDECGCTNAINQICLIHIYTFLTQSRELFLIPCLPAAVLPINNFENVRSISFCVGVCTGTGVLANFTAGGQATRWSERQTQGKTLKSFLL